MEVSPMNKTAILSFIIDGAVLKLRNVSKNMRKRVHWILEEKEVTVRKYDERALILNGSIKVGKENIRVRETEEMKKGVSNYLLVDQKELDKVMTLNNEVVCYQLSFTWIDPIEIKSIQILIIDQYSYESCSKFSFNKAKYVQLDSLSIEQIKFILTRIKRIEKLSISHSSLESIDFSPFRIKQFNFSSVFFKEPVYLPRETDELTLSECKSSNLIKTQRVKEIILSGLRTDLKEHTELVETLRGLKVARISKPMKECLPVLPSSVRKIYVSGLWNRQDNLEETVKQFPNLVDFNAAVQIEAIDKTNLKVIRPILPETKDKFSIRPRKIQVNPENAIQLNNHPELFEKVEIVVVSTDLFNFDVLPQKIKKIDICSEVNKCSETLNRLRKQY